MAVREKAIENTRVLKTAYGGLLTAVGILLPQAFHMFGQNAGMIFLPIEIPVLFAGLLLGPYYGGVIGIIVPLLSFVLTGMPPAPKVYFMVIQLFAYGMTSGIVMKRANVYISLIAAMVCGRVCYGAALAFGVHLLHMQAPFLSKAAFAGAIAAGIPGMGIQIAVIPVLYLVLKRGGFTFEQ